MLNTDKTDATVINAPLSAKKRPGQMLKIDGIRSILQVTAIGRNSTAGRIQMVPCSLDQMH